MPGTEPTNIERGSKVKIKGLAGTPYADRVFEVQSIEYEGGLEAKIDVQDIPDHFDYAVESFTFDQLELVA